MLTAPYYAAEGGGALPGTLSTAWGREQLAGQLEQARALIERFRTDECFRKAVLGGLGEEFRDVFTDPEKLSRLLAEIGAAAATGGLGLAGNAGKLARLLEKFLPERDGNRIFGARGRFSGREFDPEKAGGRILKNLEVVYRPREDYR